MIMLQFIVSVVAAIFDPMILIGNAIIGIFVRKFNYLVAAWVAYFFVIQLVIRFIALHERSVYSQNLVISQIIASIIVVFIARLICGSSTKGAS
ncbi:hypothetical protein [Azospirillum sp. B510]|uniref:hypothetical protein n=1 Tax=Azospirillum sp. (strain B510) TaxID=137722 RepID=UPI0011D059F3|nr:hypothetical protein [Azospirillum sp. B510]